MDNSSDIDAVTNIEHANSGFASTNIGNIKELQKAYDESDRIDAKNAKKPLLGAAGAFVFGLTGGLILGFLTGPGAIIAGVIFCCFGGISGIYSAYKFKTEYSGRSIEDSITNRKEGLINYMDKDTEQLNEKTETLARRNANMVDLASKARYAKVTEDLMGTVGRNKLESMKKEAGLTKEVNKLLSKSAIINMDSLHKYEQNRFGNLSNIK